MDDQQSRIDTARARVDRAVEAVKAIEARTDAIRSGWSGHGHARYSPSVDDQEALMAASDELRAAEAQLAALLNPR